MKEDLIYLTYNQSMVFMHILSEMRKNNPYFNDAISQKFEQDMLNQSVEIAKNSLKRKIINTSKANKFEVSRSMFNYLNRLTGVNPLDEVVMQEYLPLIQGAEDIAREKFEEGIKRNK